MTDTTTTTTEAAEPQSWRDLAGQLTPEQVERIEAGEQSGVLDALDQARYYVEHNEARARFADVPAPPDAIEEPTVWLWDGDGNDGENYSRVFVSFRRRVEVASARKGSLSVEVGGIQQTDGSVVRAVTVNGGGVEDVTAIEARELGGALIEAARALERIERNRHPVDSRRRECCGGIGAHGQDCQP